MPSDKSLGLKDLRNKIPKKTRGESNSDALTNASSGENRFSCDDIWMKSQTSKSETSGSKG